jgi:hypothetical protein
VVEAHLIWSDQSGFVCWRFCCGHLIFIFATRDSSLAIASGSDSYSDRIKFTNATHGSACCSYIGFESTFASGLSNFLIVSRYRFVAIRLIPICRGVIPELFSFLILSLVYRSI